MASSPTRPRGSKDMAATNFNALVSSALAMEEERERHEELNLQGALMPEGKKRFLGAVFSVVRMLKQSRVNHEAEMARRLSYRRPSLGRVVGRLHEGQPIYDRVASPATVGDEYVYNQYHKLTREPSRASIITIPPRDARLQSQRSHSPAPMLSRSYSRPSQYINYSRQSSVADLEHSTDIQALRRNTIHSARGRRESNWSESRLPSKPRFCAILSPEAEYCMMKGYEDALEKKLVEVFPGRHVLRKRPTERRISLNLTSQPPFGQQTPVPKKKPRHHKRAKSAAASPGVEGSQLRLTYMFERAMDILDEVKHKKGDMVTSRRYERPKTTVQPIRSFKAWSAGWKREFVVPLDEGQGEPEAGPSSAVTRVH